jgi:alkane 1-monooxygenase
MVKNLYMHFTYEHLYGHHRRVATPEDPASAEKGIDLYHFVVRSFFGSYKSVYLMEKNEAKKPFYANYSVLSIVASILFTLLMFKVYGVQGGLFFLLEAAGSIFYLEAINYLEHYGLRREKKPDGTYEKVTIRHSWNAPHRFSNYLLFKLQRHSDHHENSLKPYQTLLTLEESPHLPHGYPVCIFLSFFPSQWFKIMDPLVDEYNKTKKGDIDG